MTTRLTTRLSPPSPLRWAAALLMAGSLAQADQLRIAHLHAEGVPRDDDTRMRVEGEARRTRALLWVVTGLEGEHAAEWWASTMAKVAGLTEHDAPVPSLVVGAGDQRRTAVYYDAKGARVIESGSLDALGLGTRCAPPLVATFELGDSVRRKIRLVAVDLDPGDARIRYVQALLLNEWAASQNLPVVAVGRFALAWSSEHDHDACYDALVRDGRLLHVNRIGVEVPAHATPWRELRSDLFVGGDARLWRRSYTWDRIGGRWKAARDRPLILGASLWPELPPSTVEDDLRTVAALADGLPESKRERLLLAVARLRARLEERAKEDR